MFEALCPFQLSCPTGALTPGPCPSYGGVLDLDGMQAVYCRQNESGIEVACPNCGEVSTFHIDTTAMFQNWICKSCRFYKMSRVYAKTMHLPQTGIAQKTKCDCGKISFVIAPPIPDLSAVQWRCPQCNKVKALTDIIERT